MITIQMLRDRIVAKDAWQDIAEALHLTVSAKALAQTASDEIVWNAYVDGSIESEKLRLKLHSHPFPDLNSVGIYSDNDLRYHLGGGLKNAMQIAEKAEKFARPIQYLSAVLDFGCGSSRILRYMLEFLPGPHYYASEVFRENVKWGRHAFPEVVYLHQENTPPLDLPDSFFDVIYAYSIFTHLEESLHLQWLSELRRILRPGGLLIVTVHGDTILKRCKDDESVRAPMQIIGRPYEEIVSTFHNCGYVFYSCYDNARMATGGLDADRFGITYISRNYIKENWAGNFDVLEHDEGAISNWQDYVVLRKI